MTNNDILIRLRFALDLKDFQVLEVFALSGVTVSLDTLAGYLRKEEDPLRIPLAGETLKAFLRGLVTSKRGKREGEEEPKDFNLNNNSILKMIKVALKLRDDDIVEILTLAGVKVSPSEIGALLRSEGHKNFQVCRDQFLRNFLRGLALKLRGSAIAGKEA